MSERGLELRGGTVADAVLARLAPVQKIGGREETSDRLHGAALAIDRVLCFRVTRSALSGHRERQMPAGAGTRDAELLGVDLELGGIVPHEPDGAMNVLLDFRDEEPRLRAVHDRKHRVAAF